MTTQRSIAIGCVTLLLVQIAAGQQPPAPVSAGDVQSSNPASRATALAALREQVRSAPRTTATLFDKSRILDTVAAVGEFDTAAELALACVNAQPDRLDRVDLFMAVRIKALLAAKRNQEALAAAKSYYNVCAVNNTRKAIDFLGQSLAAAYPDNLALVKRFKLQQLAEGTVLKLGSAVVPAVSAGSGRGAAETAAATGAAATGEISLREDVLKSIQVDGSIYDGEGFELERNPDAQWLGKANLLLMQDKPEEARAIFERLTKASNQTFSSAAKTGLARAIKASDGNITNANEYLRTLEASLQPATRPAP